MVFICCHIKCSYFLHLVKKDEETRNLEQQLEEERRKYYEEEHKLLMKIKSEVDQIKVNATSVQPTVEYSPSYDL